jgi:hypothetical protein
MNPEYSFDEFKTRWPDMFANVYCGFSLPRGWGPFVWRLCEDLERIKAQVQVHQVKEKFGGLRFYHAIEQSSEDPEKDERIRKWAERMIDGAEQCSFYVCQTCGTTVGVTTENTKGWIASLCQTCRAAKT